MRPKLRPGGGRWRPALGACRGVAPTFRFSGAGIAVRARPQASFWQVSIRSWPSLDPRIRGCMRLEMRLVRVPGGWLLAGWTRRAACAEPRRMSIAVMNWVWANSPTSGNERLVLLALADACSRDDGTGCWPSAATIARKANISDRTVRRVITRLEAEGHLIVHRGGGRAGSTNSDTVMTGPCGSPAGRGPPPEGREAGVRGRGQHAPARGRDGTGTPCTAS